LELDVKALKQELEKSKVSIDTLTNTKNKLELYVKNLEEQQASLIEACKEKGLPTDIEQLEEFIKVGMEQIQVISDSIKAFITDISVMQTDISNDLGIR
jgi:uncharacterized protein YoxC